ncbi:MAG: HAD hydrolase-like protein [Nostoc sp.]
MCLIIGDSYNAGIAGALRADIQAILVKKPNDKNHQLYSPDFREILKIIRKLSTTEERIFVN